MPIIRRNNCIYAILGTFYSVWMNVWGYQWIMLQLKSCRTCRFGTVKINLMLTNWNNSMEQIPSWEANRFSTNKEIPRTLWKPKVHSRIHNSLSPVPIQSWINSFYAPSTPWGSILILYSHLRLGLPSGIYPSGFPHHNSLCTVCSPPCGLHTPPISVFSIWSPEQYWMRSTDH